MGWTAFIPCRQKSLLQTNSDFSQTFAMARQPWIQPNSAFFYNYTGGNLQISMWQRTVTHSSRLCCLGEHGESAPVCFKLTPTVFPPTKKVPYEQCSLNTSRIMERQTCLLREFSWVYKKKKIKLLVPATTKAKKELSCQRQCLSLQVKHITNLTRVEIKIRDFYWSVTS